MSSNEVLTLIEKAQILNCVNPQAIVLMTPKQVTEDMRRSLRSSFKDAVSGTKLEGVPVLVLACGIDIKIIDLKETNEQEAHQIGKES